MGSPFRKRTEALDVASIKNHLIFHSKTISRKATILFISHAVQGIKLKLQIIYFQLEQILKQSIMY